MNGGILRYQLITLSSKQLLARISDSGQSGLICRTGMSIFVAKRVRVCNVRVFMFYLF